MSLFIDIDEVKRVCVAGHWYDVKWFDNAGEVVSTFLIDSYEFVTTRGYEDKYPSCFIEHSEGAGGICAEGFKFVDADTGLTVSGPLTSLDAVMTVDPDNQLDSIIISKGR